VCANGQAITDNADRPSVICYDGVWYDLMSATAEGRNAAEIILGTLFVLALLIAIAITITFALYAQLWIPYRRKMDIAQWTE